jgi:hypothetical protein
VNRDPIPTEFVAFVRESGIRAFDGVASRAKELAPPLRALLRSWSKLTSEQKDALFDELIATAQRGERMADVDAPKPSRELRRYDPEEVESTLPRKPRKRG